MTARPLTALLLLACIVCPLQAQTLSTPQKPAKPKVQTEIESVRLRVQNDGEKAYFHFSESVILTATNMLLECDSLEVFAIREAEKAENIGKFGAIQEIIASGNVRIVQEERTATCDKAIVQPNQERIVLTGAPATVQQTGGTITSDEIVLNRADGRITFDGTKNRKIRLLGPAIGDLGFEQKNPVPTPQTQNGVEPGQTDGTTVDEEETPSQQSEGDASAADTAEAE
ncbi:LptA/OstA family protein [Pelagicoccus sp. SDUM812003]|uniref:LptA/OstA family protein n=1 Tax=Pelagicoccus sp. SDUM812003 TaxID=3041267 RepID=UPI00280D4FEC|nr:LptA/OstA family protein [Pelagicoccus sp. SDUM812003]MDQ8203881.1 LptA/OstA family protein [Pelagicoccus sp. SDUM812003]